MAIRAYVINGPRNNKYDSTSETEDYYGGRVKICVHQRAGSAADNTPL